MRENLQIPQIPNIKFHLDILNQVFELEKKVVKLKEENSLRRNLIRLREIYEHNFGDPTDISRGGLIFENPIGESFDETRIDCNANIAGSSTENLEIIEVIKPIVRYKKGGTSYILQKGIVVVQSRDELK